MDIAAWIAKKEDEYNGLKLKQIWRDKTLREATLKRLLKDIVENTKQKDFFIILLEDKEQQVYNIVNTKLGFQDVKMFLDEAELSNLFWRVCIIYAMGDNKAHAHFMSFRGREREQAELSIDFIFDDNVKITGTEVRTDDTWFE